MKKLLWIILLVTCGLYICGPIQDPDLWWHIVSGRWIIAHQAVPHEDMWNMFGVGNPWRAYSWSNEILFAMVERSFGIEGLLVLKLIFAGILGLSLGYCFSKIANDWFMGALLGIFATAACHNHFTLRPQSLVWIFFAWLLYVAERIRVEGCSNGLLLRIFAIMVLWANTHLSSILGLGALFLWLAPSARDELPKVKAALITLAVGFLGTLFTPYIGGEWLTLFSTSTHPMHFRAIAEFQPATILQYATGFLIMAVTLLLTMLHFQPRVIGISQLLLAAGFCVGSLAVIKFLPLAVIVTCALLALTWKRAVEQDLALVDLAFGNLSVALAKLRGGVELIPRQGLAFALICISIVNVANVWHTPLLRSVVPERAVDFIQGHNLPHPILIGFGHGGYVMYRFSDSRGNPQHLVPIDGRTNVITEEVWQKYSAAMRGRLDWQEYRKLVKPETIMWKRESPFVALLLAENEWCQVYEERDSRDPDDQSGIVIFVKREYFKAHEAELPRSKNCS